MKKPLIVLVIVLVESNKMIYRWLKIMLNLLNTKELRKRVSKELREAIRKNTYLQLPETF